MIFSSDGKKSVGVFTGTICILNSSKIDFASFSGCFKPSDLQAANSWSPINLPGWCLQLAECPPSSPAGSVCFLSYNSHSLGSLFT